MDQWLPESRQVRSKCGWKWMMMMLTSCALIQPHHHHLVLLLKFTHHRALTSSSSSYCSYSLAMHTGLSGRGRSLALGFLLIKMTCWSRVSGFMRRCSPLSSPWSMTTRHQTCKVCVSISCVSCLICTLTTIWCILSYTYISRMHPHDYYAWTCHHPHLLEVVICQSCLFLFKLAAVLPLLQKDYKRHYWR